MSELKEKAQSSDTQKCIKCGGRTALVSGYWNYDPDQEPYTDGIEESSEVGRGDAYMNGFICDDCNTIQDVFVDEENYKSRLSELESELAAVKEERDKYREALGCGEAWPITDVLQKLVESTNYLLDVYNYDRVGWEEVSYCTKLGVQYIEKINAVLAEQALKQ
ncbi:MAG TPA: hypothetical protein VD794_02205 [Flavisolibacter sp.]|nr:hypothetical protein [Flavisolibacter sp.]